MFATLNLPLRDDNRHKRLKVGRACHPCRMKKIKCDGKLACMQCKARRRRCVYLKNTDTTYIKLGNDESLMEQDDHNTTTTSARITPPLREEKPHSTDYNQYADILFDMNKNRMSTGALYSINNTHNSNSTLLSTSPGSTAGIIKNRSDKLMEELTQGLVQITLQQKLTKIKQSTFTPWQNYGDFVRWTSEPPLPDQYYGSIDMPPRLLQEHLIQIFFNQCHSFLPTMSKGMFYDQLNTRGPLITPLLLNMIYAHAATSPYGIHILKQYQQSIPSSTLLESDTFYQRARHLLDDFLDAPRISTVIALLYMVAYEDNRYDMIKSNSYSNSSNNSINQQQQQRIRSSRAWTYSGMAIRMCLELGLHTSHYSSQMSQFDIELRKRVLWTCYVVDKIESCTMERPWMIKFQDISLDLPTSLPEDDQHERIALDGFAQLCKLMIIVEEVLNFFTYEMDYKKSNNNNNSNSSSSSSNSNGNSNNNNNNSNNSCKHNNEWSSKEESYILQFLEKVYQWRARLPNELGWDPQSDQIPFSATIANLHLISYNLELSLVLCCQHQLDQLQHKRRHSAATAITHLVFIMSQHPHLVYTSSISGFSGVFAALSHAIDIDHPLMEVSENAKQQFILSLESIRKLVDKIHSQDIKRFIELIDTFLKPTKKLSSSSSSSTTSSTTSSSSFSRTPPPSQNNNSNNDAVHNNNNSNSDNNNNNNNNNNDTNSNNKISNRDLLLQHMLGAPNLFDPQIIAKTLKTLQYQQQQQQQQQQQSFPTPFPTPSLSPMEVPVSSSTNHNTNIKATTTTTTTINHNNIISTAPSSLPLLTTSYEPSSQPRPSISSTCTTPSPSIHSRINPFCLQTPEVLAAATAIGAVGTPLINPHQIPILTTTSSTTASMMPSSITIPNGPLKNIEPADYTFELISVDDEWAKSLIY
ncbi:unnamed protein product [Cunninghamella echinulata]